MKKNLKYFLMGILAICLFMYLMEGFDSATECCGPNKSIMENIYRREGADQVCESDVSCDEPNNWWHRNIGGVGCGAAPSAEECSALPNCEVKSKVSNVNRGRVAYFDGSGGFNGMHGDDNLKLLRPPNTNNRVPLCIAVEEDTADEGQH